MSCELEKICEEAEKDEDFIYIFVGGSYKKSGGEFCNCNENETNMFIECIPEKTSFQKRT